MHISQNPDTRKKLLHSLELGHYWKQIVTVGVLFLIFGSVLYLRQLSLLPACDPAAKAAKIRAFAETLFTTGGPAVDQVKALFGDEIARRLVCTHMYGV